MLIYKIFLFTNYYTAALLIVVCSPPKLTFSEEKEFGRCENTCSDIADESFYIFVMLQAALKLC